MREFFGNLPIVAGMIFSRDVLLLEDCEGSCTWTKTATDANATLTFETAAAFTGTYGMQLFSGDADPAEDDAIVASKRLSYPESGLLVTRLRLACPDLTKLKLLSLVLVEDAGTGEYYGGTLQWILGDAWYYLDASATPVELTALLEPNVNEQWLTLELVIDCRAHQYISAMANGQRVDLSGIALQDVGASTARQIYLQITATCAGAAAVTVYLDNIYVGECLEA